VCARACGYACGCTQTTKRLRQPQHSSLISVRRISPPRHLRLQLTQLPLQCLLPLQQITRPPGPPPPIPAAPIPTAHVHVGRHGLCLRRRLLLRRLLLRVELLHHVLLLEEALALLAARYRTSTSFLHFRRPGTRRRSHVTHSSAVKRSLARRRRLRRSAHQALGPSLQDMRWYLYLSPGKRCVLLSMHLISARCVRCRRISSQVSPAPNALAGATDTHLAPPQAKKNPKKTRPSRPNNLNSQPPSHPKMRILQLPPRRMLTEAYTHSQSDCAVCIMIWALRCRLISSSPPLLVPCPRLPRPLPPA